MTTTTTIEKRKRVVTDELAGVKRLLDLYPTGILSMVSDTYDLWRMCTEYLPKLKDQIMARDGKLVIRPDSGDPVDIICGMNFYHRSDAQGTSPEDKGVIELLWDLFGGTIHRGNDGNEYKLLNSHIGAIYGDSITLDRAEAICERLKAKGFASTNVVLGIGSYTYQYNTRDTFGFAMKATYGEVTNKGLSEDGKSFNNQTEAREIWKDPVTDDGTKKSAKGLLYVGKSETLGIYAQDQCTPEMEKQGLLQTVFKDGKMIKTTTLDEIREKLKL